MPNCLLNDDFDNFIEIRMKAVQFDRQCTRRRFCALRGHGYQSQGRPTRSLLYSPFVCLVPRHEFGQHFCLCLGPISFPLPELPPPGAAGGDPFSVRGRLTRNRHQCRQPGCDSPQDLFDRLSARGGGTGSIKIAAHFGVECLPPFARIALHQLGA
jgi:hypothetical protein